MTASFSHVAGVVVGCHGGRRHHRRGSHCPAARRPESSVPTVQVSGISGARAVQCADHCPPACASCRHGGRPLAPGGLRAGRAGVLQILRGDCRRHRRQARRIRHQERPPQAELAPVPRLPVTPVTDLVRHLVALVPVVEVLAPGGGGRAAEPGVEAFPPRLPAHPRDRPGRDGCDRGQDVPAHRSARLADLEPPPAQAVPVVRDVVRVDHGEHRPGRRGLHRSSAIDLASDR